MAGNRRGQLNVALGEAGLSQLEWVAGRQGKSPHAWAREVLLAALEEEEDPPPGFGRQRRAEAARDD
jgi:plasmid stability protein